MMLRSSWVSLLIADMFSLMVRADALLAICMLFSDLVIRRLLHCSHRSMRILLAALRCSFVGAVQMPAACALSKPRTFDFRGAFL